MICDSFIPLVPLLVGDDLPASQRSAVEAHVAGCHACQERVRLSEVSIAQLRSVSRSGLEDGGDDAHFSPSLWKSIAPRLIPYSPSQDRAKQFHGWVPALALVAAVLVMINFTGGNRQRPRGISLEPPSRPVEPVVVDSELVAPVPYLTGSEGAHQTVRDAGSNHRMTPATDLLRFHDSSLERQLLRQGPSVRSEFASGGWIPVQTSDGRIVFVRPN